MLYDPNGVVKLLESHGLDEYKHQTDFLLDPEVDNTHKPNVYAAGTSSGKTLTAVMKLQMYYSQPENKNKISVVMPSTNVVLRDNFAGELIDSGLTYSVIKKGAVKKQIESAIAAGVQVIVVLPQTVDRARKYLPRNIAWFVYDEAHRAYFGKQVQSILKHLKPRHQLLLTGSPSRFNAKREEFYITYVPVQTLYDAGLVTNVLLEIVSSSYAFHRHNYRTDGNLRTGLTKSPRKAEEALESVCVEMIKVLKNNIRHVDLKNKFISNLTNNAVAGLFNYLEKTIVYTNSKEQAKVFTRILKKYLGDNAVTRSDSDADKESVEFDNFKKERHIKVLVAVDRGRLGFNMPELFNVVDFTLTQNLDLLLQMYGRLLRESKTHPNKPKVYYKVAPNTMANYFRELMTAMLALTQMEWYSKYDGKNMDHITIPQALRTKPNRKTSGTGRKGGGYRPGTPKPYIPLNIPLDLNLFTECVNKNDGKFQTIAWTTLGKVKSALLGFERDRHRTFEDIIPTFDGYTDFRSWKNDHQMLYNWCRNNTTADGARCLDEIYNYTGWSRRQDEVIRDIHTALDRCVPYSSFTELINEDNKCYNYIYKNNLFDVVSNQLGWIKKNNKGKWSTFDKVFESTKGFETEKEWSTTHNSAHQTAFRKPIQKHNPTGKKWIHKIRKMKGWPLNPKSGPPKGTKVGKFTDEHRKNISLAMKGRKPWNKTS